MRLLHAKSLCFEEFFENGIPLYAILSHRWEGKEVAFHEFEAAKERDGPDFSKVKNFCSFVSRQRDPIVEWVWIDTCCIDKKSSAELSEAINSMFRWYKKSWICYAYLSSVDAGPWSVQEQQFRQSPWFTRGWTLQELIAPRKLCFLDRQWNIIRNKSELGAEISAITGIGENHLKISPRRRRIALVDTSIATKMSWVSKRKTSRPEDMAYCLLGIFDINMPLLYGEGDTRAFMRLQLEIIRKSDDESIFAWTNPNEPGVRQGMLAPWPTWFTDSGDTRPYVKFPRPPYSMTNKGLEFRVPAYTPSQGRMKVPLNCTTKDGGGALLATIELDVVGGEVGHRYVDNGVKFEDFTEFDGETTNTDVIYIPQQGL